jgi:hypothetical protein
MKPNLIHKTSYIGAFFLLAVAPSLPSAEPAPKEAAVPQTELRAGKNYIPTQVYSAEADQRILEMFRGLRVSDVVDGLDAVGLQDMA